MDQTNSNPTTSAMAAATALALIFLSALAWVLWSIGGLFANGTELLNQAAWTLLLAVAVEIVIQPVGIGKARDPKSAWDAIFQSCAWLWIGHLVILAAL